MPVAVSNFTGYGGAAVDMLIIAVFIIAILYFSFIESSVKPLSL